MPSVHDLGYISRRLKDVLCTPTRDAKLPDIRSPFAIDSFQTPMLHFILQRRCGGAGECSNMKTRKGEISRMNCFAAATHFVRSNRFPATTKAFQFRSWTNPAAIRIDNFGQCGLVLCSESPLQAREIDPRPPETELSLKYCLSAVNHKLAASASVGSSEVMISSVKLIRYLPKISCRACFSIPASLRSASSRRPTWDAVPRQVLTT
jgi:hypothetical protein